jgi:hypothetical protein
VSGELLRDHIWCTFTLTSTLAMVITEDEVKDLVRKHNQEMYEEMFGEKP